MLRVALIVFAFVVAVDAIPRLVGAASSWAMFSVQEVSFQTDMQLSAFQYEAVISGLVTGLLELAIAGVLLWQSDAIARLFWFKRTPTPPRDPEGARCPSCGAPFDPDDYVDPDTARCTQCRQPLYPQASNDGIEQDAGR
ncbi:MAG: hypothetical protein HY876_10360 [Coriobacteriales bacterium]|nr:hypothetical protein [Coriobacteriales bacterium]